MHKMSEESLQSAMAGESQAHIRYLNFAGVADKEGHKNVARLFRAASYSEQIHASSHLRKLKGIGDTVGNLKEALSGETFEVEEMYPAYEAIADAQKENSAKTSFHRALEAEKVHMDLYKRALDAVGEKKDIQVDKIWVCSVCGFTMEGSPPDKCPVCSAVKDNFKEF